MRPEYDFSTGERGKFFHANARLHLPAGDLSQAWAGPDEDLGTHIAEESRNALNAYAALPRLIREHANLEHDTAHGGYAHRQLFELVQNSADALIGLPEAGRIAIHLTDDCLYSADNGRPIDREGATALLSSHDSPKRGTEEIGRFGLGFKSVLGVTDAPEFFSRSGSFRFDRRRSHERLRRIAPSAERFPVLRLAEPIDPDEYRGTDHALGDLMDWATNIVRLPLKSDAVRSGLETQMREFPPEFLLFVKHVGQLALRGGQSNLERTIELQQVDGEYWLTEGETSSRWKLFGRTHSLSDAASADRRSLDDGQIVPIWWAAPLDRLTEPGHFWAFFPTITASLAAGILNAPWKTNEDRQNLLPGPYNDELIDAAAKLIADELPALATGSDPAGHLDALPRRHESGDTDHSDRLRRHLLVNLCQRAIVPDQEGTLRIVGHLNYPPKELTSDGRAKEEPLRRWEQYAGRPSNWLHHAAITRDRLARIEQLRRQWISATEEYPSGFSSHVSVSEWLEALVHGKTGDAAIEASKAALRTAAAIPRDVRHPHALGDIVLMANRTWHAPDPESLFLPRDAEDTESMSDGAGFVCAGLAFDHEARAALTHLGLKPVSTESRFKHFASRLLADNSATPSDTDWRRFWSLAHEVEPEVAAAAITCHRRWHAHLRIHTQATTWAPSGQVLLPGPIVPGASGRDQQVAIDLDFHGDHEDLLERLGVVMEPEPARELSGEEWFPSLLNHSRRRFRDRRLSASPQDHRLNFSSTSGAGPLDVLQALSEEGRAAYTNALLNLNATYSPWTMRHETRPDYYPELKVESPAIRSLRKHGRLRAPGGIVPFADALGSRPRNPAARNVLLAHARADSIQKAFDLVEPTPEFFGEEDPVPLADVWPGFWPVLEELTLNFPGPARDLVRCDRILVGGEERDSIVHASNIYLGRLRDDRRELLNTLQLVPQLAGLLQALDEEVRTKSRDLLTKISSRILEYEPPPTVEDERTAVCRQPTDAARLLKSVGESNLRRLLPKSLLAVLETGSTSLTGIDVAEAAVATYHTGALKAYRHCLEHLDPPGQWAGSPRAVDFVRSLGFSPEWAGERNRRRAPFVEIEGPYSLPALHAYQEVIVNKLRNMLRGANRETGRPTDGSSARAVPGSRNAGNRHRRGMISLPTGSGKTRVAVQGIVEAMCKDGFDGGVLWVADRDELCEQAVEAWTQVWSSMGAHGKRLRVSRMWAGQPAPAPTGDLHVIVATIQTLHARLQNNRSEYDFLADFKLVVFDEAHRSIAPTFTSVMEEIGLTRWQREDEPILLGLTATPYRGHDESETARLVGRYGSHRLDAGAFSNDDAEAVVSELQRMRVLALAEHETIEGGRFSLNPDELAQMTTKPRPPWLPRSVEDRIAQDSARTMRIVEAYERQVRAVDADWPALIFATSVEHAQTVAALLSRAGVPSRAVSGTTESSTRRRIVEEFRHGKLKALVNYGVFREGFDAPRTRVIIVARPVYSPNLYFQMIGRGLRGPKNGGTERCLIINIQDNIDNFEGKLAFSNLDWLWA